MSNNKRVFVSLGIVAGVVVSFLLACGFGLVFVVNTIQEEADSEDAMPRAAQRDVDAKNSQDSPPPYVEKPAVVLPQAGETDDNPAIIPAVKSANEQDELSEFIEQAESIAERFWPAIDSNDDGKLDSKEISSSRDPVSMKKADANKDGEISKAEFIISLAQRIKANAESASQTANAPSPIEANKPEPKTASTTGPKDPKQPIEPPADDGSKIIRPYDEGIDKAGRFLKFATLTIAKYDENKNGILDGAEVSVVAAKNSYVKPTADINSDGEITPKELAALLMAR